MDLSERDSHIASVEILKWIPGRQSFHYEPDLCGRMHVILDEPSPAQVAFRCDDRLVVGEFYTLFDENNQKHRIRVSRTKEDHYTATVVDA
jgi:hypothetical protein